VNAAPTPRPSGPTRRPGSGGAPARGVRQ
jgi:hypothetical protein